MFFIDLNHYFTILNKFITIQTNMEVSFIVIIIGLIGITSNYSNMLITILCIELSYIGIITAFLTNAVYFSSPKGYIYTLIILISVAAESAIGLGLIIVLYTFGKSINFTDYQELRG